MYSMIYRAARLFLPGGLERRQLLKKLNQSQWLSQEELEAQKFARLREMLKYAYENAPYYRALYSGMGIHPEDVKTRKDFASLPFLTRESVTNHREELVSPEFRDKKLFMRQSGGSTGEPTQFYVDDSFWWWNDALEWRCRQWYGVKEGEKIAWLWGADRDIPGPNWGARLKAAIKQRRLLDCRLLTSESMRRFAEEMVRWKPAMILAYPSAIALFAQYVLDRQIHGIHPRVIETSSEKLTDAQRRLAEEAFECPVTDSYTSSELGHIACQCEAGGMHVGEGNYLEVVLPDGQPARPGEMGEIVLTSLHQFAMPFIRYKINDMAVARPQACSCGRGLPTLHEIVGRKNDFIVTANGDLYSDDFVEFLQIKPEVSRYQIYQPDLEHLEARLVCKREVDSAWIENVRAELRSALDSRMEVSVQIVERIELTRAGKHRTVISDVKPGVIN